LELPGTPRRLRFLGARNDQATLVKSRGQH
jgi:hypothetical protein